MTTLIIVKDPNQKLEVFRDQWDSSDLVIAVLPNDEVHILKQEGEAPNILVQTIPTASYVDVGKIIRRQLQPPLTTDPEEL
jgi:hypothetical protein